MDVAPLGRHLEAVERIGPKPFARDAQGRLEAGIGTLFPRRRVLVTQDRMHFLQRGLFRDWLQQPSLPPGQPPPAGRHLDWECAESVDLIFTDDDLVLIRPELDRLDLAFEADSQLQEDWGVPEYHVRFLFAHNPRVRQALRERGELWRLATPAVDREAWARTIRQTRTAIHEASIYYYNAQTGTRWVTCQEFQGLAALDDATLARQLDEIAQHSATRNRHRHPEIAFFGVDPLQFGAPSFVGPAFTRLAPDVLRARYAELARQFQAATDPLLCRDDPQIAVWRDALLATLSGGDQDHAHDESPVGWGSDALFKTCWLPGGRIEDGEFLLARVLENSLESATDPALRALHDPLARGFTANLIREYGNLEYLNLGRIEPRAPAPTARRGRRGVYLAEIKVRGENDPRVLFLRVQRWGIRERLEERDEHGRPKDIVRAMLDTDEYTDYTLDRRLGCLQFGMRLPPRVTMRRVAEPYTGSRTEFHGRLFPVVYFERDYLPGIPTNQISPRKLGDPHYALALARLLGKAAAPNLIAGRTVNPQSRDVPGEVLFDDGDEIIVEGSDGLPGDLVLTDHGGAFADWRTPSLLAFARAYAKPANDRHADLQDPRAFAEAYLTALRTEFLRIQADYRRRKRAFDALFKHLPFNEDGSFACRWVRVLARLDATDDARLIGEIRRHVVALAPSSPGVGP
jgi:hypothetical protein